MHVTSKYAYNVLRTGSLKELDVLSEWPDIPLEAICSKMAVETFKKSKNEQKNINFCLYL
jgi:hypothetical protein